MHKFFIKIIISIILIILTSNDKIINKIETNIITKDSFQIITKKSKGNIDIEKINLSETLLDINDQNNNIENNITIRDIDENNNFFLLMAHSGTGPKAFFKNLKFLNIGDKITITYNNKKHIYFVTSIERQDKVGFIAIKKDQNTLVLTTCDNDKQLIIYAKI